MGINDKTKSGFAKGAFRMLGENYSLVSCPRPCEICGEVSLLKDVIEDKCVCYACWRKDYNEKVAENERVVEEFNTKRDLLLNKHSLKAC
ncbi:MAG TPA: hypothetical protein VMX17_06350 [Candidatus Glassbacteria bacterium]|nr:hypothetical protein [Candidatus Glassbacteria bacterium]